MKLYAAGSRFRVYLWEEEDGTCPALIFLKELWKSGRGKEDAADVLDRFLRQFGEHGPPRGEERCRFFDGDDVFELKAHAGGGARLIGFYHPSENAVVVFSHGFGKPPGNKAYRPEIRRAQAVREQLKAPVFPQTSSTKRASERRAKGRKGKK